MVWELKFILSVICELLLSIICLVGMFVIRYFGKVPYIIKPVQICLLAICSVLGYVLVSREFAKKLNLDTLLLWITISRNIIILFSLIVDPFIIISTRAHFYCLKKKSSGRLKIVLCSVPFIVAVVVSVILAFLAVDLNKVSKSKNNNFVTFETCCVVIGLMMLGFAYCLYSSRTLKKKARVELLNLDVNCVESDAERRKQKKIDVAADNVRCLSIQLVYIVAFKLVAVVVVGLTFIGWELPFFNPNRESFDLEMQAYFTLVIITSYFVQRNPWRRLLRCLCCKRKRSRRSYVRTKTIRRNAAVEIRTAEATLWAIRVRQADKHVPEPSRPAYRDSINWLASHSNAEESENDRSIIRPSGF